MDEGKIIAISLAVSTVGLLMLIYLSAANEPTPISAITPDDIGSWVVVRGKIVEMRPSVEGHVFFTLTDGRGRIRVAAFKEVAQDLRCLEEGRNIELKGLIEEYRGEIEIIPSRAADVKCR